MDSDLAVVTTWSVVAIVSAFVAAIPVLVYRHVVSRQRDAWNTTTRVPSPGGGAYRAGLVEVSESRGVPRIVRVATMWSLFMLVPAIASLPFLGLGLFYATGPALLFGPLGLFLAVLVFRAGQRLPEASAAAATFAKSVAITALGHNVFVVASVAIVTAAQPDGGTTWEAWTIQKIGGAAIAYAVVSIAHAFVLLEASKAHARFAEQRDEAAADEAQREYAGAR